MRWIHGPRRIPDLHTLGGYGAPPAVRVRRRGSRLRLAICSRRPRAHQLGTVKAPDQKAAETVAVKSFGLAENERQRLLIWERD
jgi:hypothetical protein